MSLSISLIKPDGWVKSEKQISGSTVSRILPEQLGSQRLYIFFENKPCRELLIVTALNQLFFQTYLNNISKQFKIFEVKFRKFNFIRVSFPKKYLDKCSEIAKLYDMKICHKELIIKDKSKAKNILKVPSSKNILSFTGKHRIKIKAIWDDYFQLLQIGSSLSFLKSWPCLSSNDEKYEEWDIDWNLPEKTSVLKKSTETTETKESKEEKRVSSVESKVGYFFVFQARLGGKKMFNQFS